MQIVGQPVFSTGAATSSFPATSSAVCKQTYQGTFESSTNYRACTVEVPQTGKVIYAGFGIDRFDWVQTTRIARPPPQATSSSDRQPPAAPAPKGPSTTTVP